MEASKSQLDLLDQAIDTERKGYEFYVEAAGRVQDGRAQKLFRSLADDELVHRRFLEEVRKRLSIPGSGSADAAALIESTAAKRIRPSIIPDDPKKVAKLAKPDASDVEALETGIRIERGSYKFYSEAASKTDDLDARSVYEGLARWEHQHLADLDEYHEFLTNPTSYWMKHDRPILEG